MYLSGTLFADSSVLHALLDTRRSHGVAEDELVVAGPLHVAVDRLFEVTGTRSAFRMTQSLETALPC
ncbi:hypothetical protein [Streptomyces sp. NPDC057939]|uniref:hypothetical protein n=1 Tax=Streptomyces sp. NPDC057939 TaxID=3346284 RepID=UPI0036E1AE96